MGHVLRLIVPAASCVLALAAPAAAVSPRASAAAQERAERALDEAEDLRAGRGVRTGRELTPALHDLAVRVRHLRGDVRRRAVELLARPTDSGDPDAYPPGTSVEQSCAGDFCVHWAASDLGAVAMAPTVLTEAAAVRAFENGTLGWRTPPNDGDGRVDIYLKDLGPDKLFGFVAPDLDQGSLSASSYLVIDNDFDPAQYSGQPTAESLRLTLAHEYGHVLQYGYDVMADNWHYESSATWLEHRYDSALQDWLSFLRQGSSGPGWPALTEVPLTTIDDSTDPRGAKLYGNVVWNHFLSGRHGARGDEVQRRAWEASDGLSAPSTSSYDDAIRAVGGSDFSSDFAAFAAAAAEWRVPELGFALPGQLPEVERRGSLPADGPAATPTMDHLTFALYDVPDSSAARIRLAAAFPAGVHGALALVARGAAGSSGPVTTRLLELPNGGTGGVTLDNPHDHIAAGGRITAVLVNADWAQRGFGRSDWIWSSDGEPVAAAVTTDLSGPAITRRTPAPNATRVRPAGEVKVTFSKPVSGVDSRSFVLRGPNGRTVPASVSYVSSSRTAVLVPSKALGERKRYSVRLTDAIVDASATKLAPTEWSFRTARQRPRVTVDSVSTGPAGVLFRIRSADADRLRWSARLSAGGRRLSTKRGAVAAGALRIVRLAVAGTGRARLVVTVRDPQRLSKRIVRAVRLRR